MKLSSPPWQDNASLQLLMRHYNDAGHAIRLVGGVVRDAVMARAISDIDCATTALPEQGMALLEQAGIKVIPTGIEHGTITAVIDGMPFEITTLRSDVACDGRHADVVFSADWQADSNRRDFTMNALYADLGGTIHDYHSGIDDAKAGRVRFIGHAHDRITEDSLRILRFFRFFATHATVAPDEAALAACAQYKNMLHDLSGERIQQEMVKLLEAPNALHALTHMHESGVLTALFPTIDFNPAILTRYYIHASGNAPMIAALLCVMCEDVLTAATHILHHWKCPNAWHKLFTLLLTSFPLHDNSDDAAIKAAIRVQPHFLAHATFAYAAGTLSQDAFAQMQAIATEWIAPVFPVSGDDLIANGVTPGPALGAQLAALEAKWEASAYSLSKEELLAQL